MKCSKYIFVAYKQDRPKVLQHAHLVEIDHHITPDVYALSGHLRQDVLLTAIFSCRLLSFVVPSERINALSASIVLGW